MMMMEGSEDMLHYNSMTRRTLIGSAFATAAIWGAAPSFAQSFIMPMKADIEPWLKPDNEALIPTVGGNIYVRSNGEINDSTVPLVVIHGGPGSNHSGFLPALKYRTDRPLIMYDQLDCGNSDAPGDPANWNIARFVQELDDVLNHFGAKRYNIMGHSWGGTVLLEYTREHQDRINGAIFLGSLISTKDWLKDTNKLREKLDEDVQKVLTECEQSDDFSTEACQTAMDAFYAEFLRRNPRPAEIVAYREQMKNLWNQKLYEYMWGQTEFTSTGNLKDYDGTDQLDNLHDMNTFFVCGEYDEARPETYQKFAKRAEGEFEVVANAAHDVFTDNPEATYTTVEKWMKQID